MVKSAARIVIFIVIFSGSLLFEARPDTFYLKNGHSLEGFMVGEDDSSLELDVGFGTIKVEKGLILRITRSGPQESALIRQNWEKARQEARDWKPPERTKEETGQEEQEISVTRQKPLPQDIEVQRKGQHIFVDTVLNREIRASLMLDTGSSLIVLSKEVGEELGFDTEEGDPEDKAGMVSMTMADGTKTLARFVRLESVSVEGVEAENVAAAVLLNDQVNAGFKDGLLGMSFLNRFNFKIDRENDRIILEEIN